MGHRRPGYCPAGTGRVDEAAEYFTRADAAGDQVGADAGSILRTYGQAIMASDRGQYAAALALFVQAHDGFQRLEVAFPTGLALAGSLPPTNISVTPAAQDGYQRLLRHAESSGEMGLTASALEGLAPVALADREPAPAPELLARAAAVRDTYDRQFPECDIARTSGCVVRS